MTELKKKREGRRVLLDDKAVKQVSQLSLKLKHHHCKATHSQIVSRVVSLFLDRYLEKEWKSLEKGFFDKKTYLKAMLDSSNSEEELTSSVKTFLKKVKGGQVAKRSDEV